MRAFIGVFVLISVLIALNPNAYITTLMSISWGALAGSFLAPFLFGLFSKKITKPAVWTSFAAGVGITVAHMLIFSLPFSPMAGETVRLLGINVHSPINAGACAMLTSLIVVPLVSLFTKVKNADDVEAIFKEIA
jgi:SSS family solute:Na+ symporter